MNTKTSTKKKTRRRRRKSKAESVFGAFVIEGLGLLAVVVMFVFARQASEVQAPEMADSDRVEFNSLEVVDAAPEYRPAMQWRIPDSNRFERIRHQASDNRFAGSY